jgi:hypothetical protein
MSRLHWLLALGGVTLTALAVYAEFCKPNRPLPGCPFCLLKKLDGGREL